jgi:hypothetical protein
MVGFDISSDESFGSTISEILQLKLVYMIDENQFT